MLTKLTHHNNHEVKIHLTRGLGPHYAALRCLNCNCHIQWISKIQAEKIKAILQKGE